MALDLHNYLFYGILNNFMFKISVLAQFKKMQTECAKFPQMITELDAINHGIDFQKHASFLGRRNSKRNALNSLDSSTPLNQDSKMDLPEQLFCILLLCLSSL